jgi:hypothetical protein
MVNIIGSFAFYRLDLTAEKRYTLAPSTRKMLKELLKNALLSYKFVQYFVTLEVKKLM